MGKLKLHVTLDYEVWGNGQGCVQQCIIEPTNKLVRLLEDFQIRTTLFVDVCEFWAFRESEQRGIFKDKSYLPATWIENQLRELHARGHDVQLHFHPQWLNYKYLDDHAFEVDYSLWRLSSLSLGDDNTPNTLNWLFKKGKEELETLLIPVNPEYRCNKFRAGAWSIQPEANVLTAMNRHGFQYDFTAAPGAYFHSDTTSYDFRNCPSALEWKVLDSISKESNEGIITEVPIATTKYAFIDLVKFYSKRKAVVNSQALNCDKVQSVRTGLMEKVLRYLQSSVMMFDITARMSEEELIFNYQKQNEFHAEELEKSDKEIVVIGHPKNYRENSELRSFLEYYFESIK